MKNDFLRLVIQDKTLRSSILSLISWFLPALLNLFVPISIIRSIGADEYGLYSLLLSIVGYFSILDLSLDAFLIPAIRSNNSKNYIEFSRSFFTLGAILSIIFTFLILFGLKITGSINFIDLSLTLILGFSFFSGFQLMITSSYIIESGTNRLDNFSKRNLFGNILFLISVILFIYLQVLSVSLIIYTRIVTSIFISIHGYQNFSLKHLKIPNSTDFNKKNLKEFIKVSLFGKASSYITFNLDKLILSNLVSLSILGFFAFASQIGIAMVMGFSKFCLPILPIASTSRSNIKDLDILISKFLTLYAIGGLGLCSVLIWLDRLMFILFEVKIDTQILSSITLLLVGFYFISSSAIYANILPSWGMMKSNVISSVTRSIIILMFGIFAFITKNFSFLGFGFLIGGLWDLYFLNRFFRKFRFTMSTKRFKSIFLITGSILLFWIILHWTNIHFPIYFEFILLICLIILSIKFFSIFLRYEK